MRKRTEQEDELALSPKKEEQLVRWDALFRMYATPAEKVELDRFTDRERRYRFMRGVVLSELELLAQHGRGELLARILLYLSEAQLREVCRLSTTIYDVCKTYKLEERFLVGNLLFYQSRRIATQQPVVSVAVNDEGCTWVTENGGAYRLHDPMRLLSLPDVGEPMVSVTAGPDFFMFITRNTRRVYGHGRNRNGQLGVGDFSNTLGLRQTLVDERVRKVVCTFQKSAILTETGNLYTCGLGPRLQYHAEPFPQLLNSDFGIEDVSIYKIRRIVALTQEDGKIITLTENGWDVLHVDPNIERVYGELDGVAYKDATSQNVYRLDGNNELLAENVKEFKYGGTYLRNDGSLVIEGIAQNLPLPVKTFDWNEDQLAYVFSDATIPVISVECVQCGQSAEYFAPGTYEPYCSDAECIGKRDRDEDGTPPPPAYQRQRQDDLNVLRPTTQVILENPQRLQEFAMQVSREEILNISLTEDGSLYGQLNRNNTFWYWISKRFLEVGFNRLVNYKDIAGRLI